jgi:hypothetical protein
MPYIAHRNMNLYLLKEYGWGKLRTFWDVPDILPITVGPAGVEAFE